MSLLKRLQEASVFKAPSKEEEKERHAKRVMPTHMSHDDPVDQFRFEHSGKSLATELDKEAEKIGEEFFDSLDSQGIVITQVHPDAKYLYVEHDNDPAQYAELIHAKGDFIEQIAVAAVEKEEMDQAMAANTLEELDALEKWGGSSEFMEIPKGSKYLVTDRGMDPVFYKTSKDLRSGLEQYL